MLGRFLKINSETIPNPKPDGFNETSQTIEQVNQSEAGTDLVSVTRSSKLVLSMTFDLTSSWKGKLDAYSRLLSVTLNYNGVDYVGRFRSGGAQLVGNSAHTEGTDGLWTCSYTFTEI